MKPVMLGQILNESFLVHWYQPICDLISGNVLGYEALVRNTFSSNILPSDIFKEAYRQKCLSKLDRELLLKAQHLFKKNQSSHLFINAFPSTLLEPGFIEWWDTYSNIVPSLVIELSEGEVIEDWDSIKFTVKQLKGRGIKIAIDDMGTGYMSLKHVTELEPDYIKIDRYFMIDLDKSLIKQRIIKSLIKGVEGLSEVIIEGVEDKGCLNIARELGIQYAQGYALGVPAPLNSNVLISKCI